MDGFQTIKDLFGQFAAYPFWQVAVELALIGAIIYAVWRFVRGTRAAGVVNGIILLVIATLAIRLLTPIEAFERVSYLYDRFLGFVVIALVIVFAPELRRALIRIGEAPFFRSSVSDVTDVVEALVSASTFLSKNKFGSIIAIERQIGLRETTESGRTLNADLSADLLQSIFWPNNPLHDMGVVVRGAKILAAGVQFPLAEPGELNDAALGTRHRAAIGLTKASDALVIIVSEENGAISLAERGRLQRWLTPEALRSELTRRLAAEARSQQLAGDESADEPAPEEDGAEPEGRAA